jgi:hypothetical protein|tara:strand:+ start:9171 stop:9515 length:345 start_codon:yes stop_codon:yes gene_type:complete
MVSAFKFIEHIQQTLSAGAELTVHKGVGTNDANNVYLNLYSDSSFTNLVLKVSTPIFITDINENELEDAIVVDEEGSTQTGGFKIDFNKTVMHSFTSLKLLGGAADSVISVLII